MNRSAFDRGAQIAKTINPDGQPDESEIVDHIADLLIWATVELSYDLTMMLHMVGVHVSVEADPDYEEVI